MRRFGSFSLIVFVLFLSIVITDVNAGWQRQSPVTTTGRLHGVWGNSGDDVFAVGWWGTILHYDGSSWKEMISGTDALLYDIWGSSGNDVFAVGTNGTILHYDGSSWKEMISGTTSYDLWGVWGSSGTDVFAVGENGIILHYDGTTWMTSFFGSGNHQDVWGSSGENVFVVSSKAYFPRIQNAIFFDLILTAEPTSRVGRRLP